MTDFHTWAMAAVTWGGYGFTLTHCHPYIWKLRSNSSICYMNIRKRFTSQTNEWISVAEESDFYGINYKLIHGLQIECSTFSHPLIFELTYSLHAEPNHANFDLVPFLFDFCL